MLHIVKSCRFRFTTANLWPIGLIFVIECVCVPLIKLKVKSNWNAVRWFFLVIAMNILPTAFLWGQIRFILTNSRCMFDGYYIIHSSQSSKLKKKTAHQSCKLRGSFSHFFFSPFLWTCVTVLSVLSIFLNITYLIKFSLTGFNIHAIYNRSIKILVYPK